MIKAFFKKPDTPVKRPLRVLGDKTTEVKPPSPKVSIFYPDGDFNSKKREALEVALDKYQVSMAASIALAARKDRSSPISSANFMLFMQNAQKAASMIENPALIQSVTNFLTSGESSFNGSRSTLPSAPADIKENILMQKKLKNDNDADGKIDNSFEAIMRRLGN